MRPARALAVLLLAALALGGCDVGEEDERPPQIGPSADDEQAAAELGFPATATRNTIRVGGGDVTADVAGVVSALFPATTPRTRPPAVALVDRDAWQAGIASAALAADPVGVPALLSDGGELAPVSEDTLDRLDPQGSDLSKDAQVIRVGDAPPSPGGRKVSTIAGRDPFELAAAIDRYSSIARGEPSNDVIVASGERAPFAMPAAAWAARSGDSVLFTRRDALPPATARALREHQRPDIFVLGPETVISTRVERELRRLGQVRRIEGATPVENAIAFARYRRRDFGWGIAVPGYNFTVANTDRPLDAVASAPLGANGIFAPLLLTDQAAQVSPALENYFLDVQPGFTEGDPGNAVYNRVWVLGDDSAVSIAAQARLDEITELVPVQEQAP